MPKKPVLVETYDDPTSLESRLNELAGDPFNKHDLKFITHSGRIYTIILIYTP